MLKGGKGYTVYRGMKLNGWTGTAQCQVLLDDMIGVRELQTESKIQWVKLVRSEPEWWTNLRLNLGTWSSCLLPTYVNIRNNTESVFQFHKTKQNKQAATIYWMPVSSMVERLEQELRSQDLTTYCLSTLGKWLHFPHL